jgi:hypothetical protein
MESNGMKNRTREMVDEVCSGRTYDFDDLQKDLRRKKEVETARRGIPCDVTTDAHGMAFSDADSGL